MRYADLHTHTFHSDGTRSPREVIDLASSHGIEIIAISDHDNLAAYFEIKGYADEAGATLIPAAELSAEHQGIDIHVLAYAVDPLDDRLNERLAKFREDRLTRGHRMCERLLAAGYPISTERVLELCGGGAMGRPHVARALIEAGHVSSMKEAFDQLLRPGRPGFVAKPRFAIGEVVELVHSAGGLTSVAHPSLYPEHRRLVTEVLDLGVDGIEVFHPEVDPESRRFYTALASDRGLMITGGSDDHGTAKTTETLGTVKVEEKHVRPILDRM